MKYALAPRQVAFGLFQLSDLVVGAQTSLSVATYLHQETQNPRYAPSAVLAKMVADGRTGIDVGKGYYDYEGVSTQDARACADKAFSAVYLAQEKLEPLFELPDHRDP